MNYDYDNIQKGLQVLKSQGIDTREMETAVRERLSKTQPNMMTTTDGVYIEQSQPDVPGVYIDSYQQQQDLFNQELAKKQMFADRMSQQSGMNAPFSPIVSPHYSVVENSQRVSVGPNGQIIYL